jgi:uncharacterized membrane protein
MNSIGITVVLTAVFAGVALVDTVKEKDIDPAEKEKETTHIGSGLLPRVSYST